MLLFNSDDQNASAKNSDFNTSNVTIQLTEEMLETAEENFNTSNVTIQPRRKP